MDFKVAIFRGASSSISPVLIGKKDEELEKRRLKLHEAAIKIEQIHSNLLEQHDKKLLERLNADLADYSVFIPLYPELSHLHFASNWRSPVEGITCQLDRTVQVTRKHQRESDRSPVEEITCQVDQTGQTGQMGQTGQVDPNFQNSEPDKEISEPDKKLTTEKQETHLDKKPKMDLTESRLIINSKQNEEKISQVRIEGTKGVTGTSTGTGTGTDNFNEHDKASQISADKLKKKKNLKVQVLKKEWFCDICNHKIVFQNPSFLEQHFKSNKHIANLTKINQNSQPKPDNNLISQKPEPVKESINEKPEPDKNLVNEKSEPVKELISEKPDPVKNPITQESKPVKELIIEKPEPVKNPITQESKPVMKPEPVKKFVNCGPEEEPCGTRLNKKQKLDLSKPPLMIKNKSEPNEDKTSQANYKASQLNHNQYDKNRTVPVPHINSHISKKFTKNEKEEFYCKLCNIKAHSKHVLEDHLYGRRHKVNLKELLNGSSNGSPKFDTNKNLDLRELIVRSESNALNAGTSTGTSFLNAHHKESQKSRNDFGNNNTFYRDQFKKGEMYCNLCNIKTTSKRDLIHHFEGQKHRASINSLLNGSLTGTDFVLNGLSGCLFCTLCNKTCGRLRFLNEHIGGQKHQQKIKLNGSE